MTGVLFGILPALRAVQADPGQALEDARAGGAPRQSHTRRALVALQIALSLALLVGAGLFVQSLRKVNAVRSGVDVDRVLVARLDLRRAHYTPEMREAFYDTALTRLSNLAGVERAAIAHHEPFQGASRRRSGPCRAKPRCSRRSPS